MKADQEYLEATAAALRATGLWVGFSEHLRTWLRLGRNTLWTSSFGKSFRHGAENLARIRRVISVAKTAPSQVPHQKQRVRALQKTGDANAFNACRIDHIFAFVLEPNELARALRLLKKAPVTHANQPD